MPVCPKGKCNIINYPVDGALLTKEFHVLVEHVPVMVAIKVKVADIPQLTFWSLEYLRIWLRGSCLKFAGQRLYINHFHLTFQN